MSRCMGMGVSHSPRDVGDQGIAHAADDLGIDQGAADFGELEDSHTAQRPRIAIVLCFSDREPMGISRAIAEQMERSSWIRRMFEIGIQLRQERGAENVFDFTLGNPDVEPPEAVIAALRRVVAENRPHSHGYMPNAGFPEVRATIARGLAERTGLPFTGDDVIMTSGRGGRHQHGAQIDSRSRRRSHRAEPVFPGVPLLHREPRRPRGHGGDRRAVPARYPRASPRPSRRAPRR